MHRAFDESDKIRWIAQLETKTISSMLNLRCHASGIRYKQRAASQICFLNDNGRILPPLACHQYVIAFAHQVQNVGIVICSLVFQNSGPDRLFETGPNLVRKTDDRAVDAKDKTPFQFRIAMNLLGRVQDDIQALERVQLSKKTNDEGFVLLIGRHMTVSIGRDAIQ